MLVAAIESQAEVIPFDSERWVITNGRMEEFLGQRSLVGQADLKDITFEDGVIEVDIAVDGSRCFPGIAFRTQEERNLELFYMRPHKPKMPDALQYTPVSNGLSSWQLYNGRGFTAAADFPYGEWIHLRLEVSGTRARLYLGDDDNPALVIHDLKHGLSKGGVGLRAPAGGQVHFANFEIRETVERDFGPSPKFAPGKDMITSWHISQAFSVSDIDRARPLEAQELGDLKWQAVEAGPDGLVDVARFVTKKPQVGEVVLARAVVESDRDETQRLAFGYSDEVSLFVNGELLFRGNGAFRSRDEQFQGIVGLHDAVYPRLRKGSNEILLMVAETFGGWGFKCQLGPVQGPEVTHENVSLKWQINEGLKAPESVAFDPEHDVLYVANYNPSRPGAKTGFLSKVSKGGDVLEMEWIGELNGPTGLSLKGSRLYIVERDGVVVVDTNSGQIASRTACPSNGMLNDSAVASDGVVYVSDSRRHVIYRLRDEECEAWLEGWPLENPNGLLVEDDTLVVGNLTGGNLLFIDRESKAIEAVIELGPGLVDGVRSDGKGNYIVSQYEGRVLRVRPSGETDVLVDTTDAQIYCADLDFDPKHRLIVVPTLFGNQLLAYGLNEEVGDETETISN
jgi:hypothetical protein